DEETTLDEEEDDHSYPASGVHTPMPYDEADPLLSQLEGPRSSLGFVAASLALIAAAIGGVAFFAMGGHASNANADENAVTATTPATLTSAVAPASTPRSETITPPT